LVFIAVSVFVRLLSEKALKSQIFSGLAGFSTSLLAAPPGNSSGTKHETGKSFIFSLRQAATAYFSGANDTRKFLVFVCHLHNADLRLTDNCSPRFKPKTSKARYFPGSHAFLLFAALRAAPPCNSSGTKRETGKSFIFHFAASRDNSATLKIGPNSYESRTFRFLAFSPSNGPRG
jgi:hypothetical protein